MGVDAVVRWFFGILLVLGGIACLASILFPGAGPRPPWVSGLNLVYLVSAAVLFGLSYFLTIHLGIREARARSAREKQLMGDKYNNASVLMDRLDKGHEGPWVLELLADRALLHSTKEETAVEIPLASAEKTILLPGFAEERSKLEFRLEGQTMTFMNPGGRTKVIRKWLDWAIAITQPGLRHTIRKKAILNFCLGVILVLAGPALFLLLYTEVKSWRGGTYEILFGILMISLAGLVFLSKGIVGVRRHSRLKSLASVLPDAEAKTPPGAV